MKIRLNNYLFFAFIFATIPYHVFAQFNHINYLKLHGIKGKVKKYTSYQYKHIYGEKFEKTIDINKEHLTEKTVTYFDATGIETKQLHYYFIHDSIQTVIRSASCVGIKSVSKGKVKIIYQWTLYPDSSILKTQQRPDNNNGFSRSDTKKKTEISMDTVVISNVNQNIFTTFSSFNKYGYMRSPKYFYIDSIFLNTDTNIVRLVTSTIEKKYNDTYTNNDGYVTYSYKNGELDSIFNSSIHTYNDAFYDDFGLRGHQLIDKQFDKFRNILTYTEFSSTTENKQIKNGFVRTMKYEYEYY